MFTGKDSCQGDSGNLKIVVYSWIEIPIWMEYIDWYLFHFQSGGPLMHEKNGRWYLIGKNRVLLWWCFNIQINCCSSKWIIVVVFCKLGVVSAGYSCASRGQPGIYHRVPYTVDWISYVSNLNK